ncbi:MAG: glycosyltransferase, partial [Acidaminococcaceae bacterium]|nr:glycosyltransferase [Acidaminococcaceae bacterium]
MTIYISNNEKNDKETERIINLLCEKFDNIVYFTNEKNIGIDCNHDKVYEYCNEEYGLFLADDDVVFENAIVEIMTFINQRECLFAICNSYTMDGNEKKKKRLFNLHDEDVTKYDHLSFVRFFAFKRPISLLPLLPYYGGIIVNIAKMKQRSKKFSREIFSGTFHQYIGAILNVFFESNDMKCFIIGMPFIGIGMDNDKTWFEYKEKVYEGV